MTHPGCGKLTKKGRRRKHTPIVSKAQRGLFGARAGGKKTKAAGLTIAEAKRHRKEVAGKKLPARKSKLTKKGRKKRKD